MNNTFSYHRFLSLLKKEALDLRPKFRKFLLISFCIGLATFLFANYLVHVHEGADYDKVRFIIGFLVVIGNMFFASSVLYKRFNHRIMGVNHFMLPASQLEKWLSMFFYCVIVIPILSILALTVVDLCLLPLYPWEGISLWFLDDAFAFVLSLKLSYTFLFSILWVQSLFFLCNIWFQNSKVQKTFAVIIIVLIANNIFSLLLHEAFPPVAGLAANISKFAGDSSGAPLSILREIFVTSGFWRVGTLLLSTLIPLGVWYASFLKWKEQEL